MLALLPQATVESYQLTSYVAGRLLCYATSGQADPQALGDLAWLAVFDDEDRAECVSELRDQLAIAEATRDGTALTACLKAWRDTAVAQ